MIAKNYETHEPADLHAVHDISPAARAVRITDEPYKDHKGRDVRAVNFHVGESMTMGMVRNHDKLILLYVGANDGDGRTKYQNTRRGYGYALVQRAIKYAADNNLRFFVNQFVPDQVQPLFQKLQRKGYDVRIPAHWRASASVEIGTTDASFGPFEVEW